MAKLIAVVLFLFVLTAECVAQDTKTVDVPSDEEINLLMKQADRGFAEYERLTKQEESLLSNDADVSTDLKLIRAWKAVRVAVDKDPQKFNSFAGFDVATMIDDAARNVTLISNLAATEALKQITSGKVTNKTDLLVTLMQSANATGNLLFTISENAAAMYRKFNYSGRTHAQSSKRREALRDIYIDVAENLIQHCIGIWIARSTRSLICGWFSALSDLVGLEKLDTLIEAFIQCFVGTIASHFSKRGRLGIAANLIHGCVLVRINRIQPLQLRIAAVWKVRWVRRIDRSRCLRNLLNSNSSGLSDQSSFQ